MDEEDLDTISASPFAPPNERRQEILQESGTGEPVAKKPRLSVPVDDEEYESESLPNFGFDPLNPENFYDSPVAEEEETEPVEESLSDLNEDEINLLINDDTEVRMNEIIWESMYSDWEKEQQGLCSILWL